MGGIESEQNTVVTKIHERSNKDDRKHVYIGLLYSSNKAKVGLRYRQLPAQHLQRHPAQT